MPVSPVGGAPNQLDQLELVQHAAASLVVSGSSSLHSPPAHTCRPYLAKLSLEGLGDLLPLCIASLREHVDDGLLVGPCRGHGMSTPISPRG